jgi:hypothetical protein
MKTFRIFHKDGKPETVEASSAIAIKKKDGLTIKIGKRVITDAIMLTEIIAEIQPPKREPADDDRDA